MSHFCSECGVKISTNKEYCNQCESMQGKLEKRSLGENILLVVGAKLEVGLFKKKQIILIITDSRFAIIMNDVGFFKRISTKPEVLKEYYYRYYSQSVVASLAEHSDNFFVDHKKITSIRLFLGKRSLVGSTTTSSGPTALDFIASEKKHRIIFDDVSVNTDLNNTLEPIYGKLAVRDSKWV